MHGASHLESAAVDALAAEFRRRLLGYAGIALDHAGQHGEAERRSDGT
jgi:hypothetical protein